MCLSSINRTVTKATHKHIIFFFLHYTCFWVDFLFTYGLITNRAGLGTMFATLCCPVHSWSLSFPTTVVFTVRSTDVLKASSGLAVQRTHPGWMDRLVHTSPSLHAVAIASSQLSQSLLSYCLFPRRSQPQVRWPAWKGSSAGWVTSWVKPLSHSFILKQWNLWSCCQWFIPWTNTEFTMLGLWVDEPHVFKDNSFVTGSRQESRVQRHLRQRLFGPRYSRGVGPISKDKTE